MKSWDVSARVTSLTAARFASGERRRASIIAASVVPFVSIARAVSSPWEYLKARSIAATACGSRILLTLTDQYKAKCPAQRETKRVAGLRRTRGCFRRTIPIHSLFLHIRVVLI